MKMRLQKFLSQVGIASRRKAETMIRELRVEICDDKLCRKAGIGEKIDPTKEIVKVDNKIIGQNNKLVYYALNKPVGYTCSLSDIHAQKLVIDLVPACPKVWPVGRLDKDSSGLIILTNDGELTNLLTHPKYRHEKEYRVKIQIPNNKSQINFKSQIQKLQNPIRLTEGVARFDKIKILKIDQAKNLVSLSVVLHQGWKRQIRRMAEKAGFRVLELQRTRIAKLKLADLAEGKYKIVNKDNII